MSANVVAVNITVVGYDESFTTKLNASPAGGAQIKMIVTQRCIASATAGVWNGLFCIIRPGNGVIPSLPSSCMTRAACY